MGVHDVEAVAPVLEGTRRGAVNGPMDSPWGIRTASFRDPGGRHLGDREVI